MNSAHLPATLRDAFERPTLKQKEDYGRFAHNLAAAAIIGAVTVLFFSDASLVGALRITGLMLSALICFALGAVLTKGE